MTRARQPEFPPWQAAAENRPLPEDDFLVLSVQEPLGFDPDYFGKAPARPVRAMGVGKLPPQ
jgi:hypothetical protein